MNETKKYDFLATLVKNPDLSIADLRQNNITPDNSSLLSKDEYKNMPGVIEAFKDSSGNFDDKKFSEYYDNARVLYSNYANDELFSNVANNLTYGEDAWFAPQDAIYRNDNPIILLNNTPLPESRGIKFITESYAGNLNLSIRELAQREKIVDFETGEEFDYSPNDKAGLFKRFEIPTVVLAQWDEDGTHLENGIEVPHKAGDIKLNKRGRPYYETLSNREIYNKDVLRKSDVLTIDGSKWNKLDIWDSDDIKKSPLKVALNLVADVAPMFIPGVGEIYGYIGAAAGIARVAPVLGKTINAIATGDNSNKIGQGLSKWEGFMASFDQTQSDWSREHLVSWEGLGNLISDISKQLFEQRAVATIPSLLKKTGAFNDHKNLVNWSRNLPLAYMAATSAQQVYGDFKQAGASDRMAGLGMLASTLALYKLMNIDYFRDNLFRDTFMDESEIRAALRGASKETADKIGVAAAITTPKEAATFTQKFSNFYQNVLLKSITQKGLPGLAARGLSEAVEETMEEVTTDLVKVFTEGLNALGFKVTEPEKSLDFGWSAKDIVSRYGMSFAGGFLGGMIFAGQNRYQKWLDSLDGKIPQISHSDMEKLVYYIASGKRGEIDSYLDKWHDKGVLGSKNLSVDGDIISTWEGTDQFIPKTEGVSQNDAVYQTLKNTLDTIQQAIESEVPDSRYFTKEGLENLMALGYNDSNISEKPQLLTASTIVALGDYSSFQNDLYKNLASIVETKQALDARIKELQKPGTTQEERKTISDSIANDSKIKELQQRLAELREEKTKFFAGQKNQYYSGQALFAANQNLNHNFVNIDLENYTKLKYGRSFKSFNEEQQKDIKAEHDEYIKVEGRNNVYRAYDLYLDLSTKYADVVQKHGENLDKLFKEEMSIPRIMGQTHFNQAKAEYVTLNSELLELNALENPTPEQESRKIEIESRKAELAQQFSLMLLNPQYAEATSVNEDLLLDARDVKGKVVVADDLTAGLLTPEVGHSIALPTLEILKHLRQQYKFDAETGKYRFDDAELLAFLNGIKSSYISTGGAERRISEFANEMTNFPERGYIDEEEFMPIQEIADKIELDPTSPAWITGRALTKSEYTRIIDNLVNNLGIDNHAVISSFNELLDLVKSNSKLLEPGNEQYLQDFLKSVLPTINGELITDIISEIDDYREKINYSAFLELADKLGTDVNDLSLLKLVQQESMNLAKSNRLDDYLIRNEAVRQSLSKERLSPIFNVVTAVVTGAADGTNHTINNFKNGDVPVLAEMSDNAARHILLQKSMLEDKINFLTSISDSNQSRSFRKHKDTAINMTPKFVKSILDIADSIQNELNIDVKTLWTNAYGKLDIGEIDENNYTNFEKAYLKFSQDFYDQIHEKTLSNEELANKLLNLVNKANLYKSKLTSLSDRADETISELDLIYHLATLASLPTESFYQAYITTLSDENIASVPGQEYAIKQTIANILNPDLFNKILDGIQNNTDYSGLDTKVRNYLENKTKLYNTTAILGGAGTGKTVGVIKKILQTLTGSANIDVVYLAKEKSQAENIKNAAGFGDKVYTVDEYETIRRGAPVSDYEFNTETGHFEAKSSMDTTGDVFDSSTDIKLIVVDEIETLTEPELARLSADGVVDGLFVIGAGDLKQPGTDVFAKNNKGHDVVYSSGIEDCAFIRTPTLTTTMRAQTIANVVNAEVLDLALTNVLNQVQEDPTITLDKRNSIAKEVLSEKKLYYYKDTNTGELSGAMNTTTQEQLLSELDNLKNLDGEILIVADKEKLGSYAKYASDKVKVIPYERRAGVEADYVLVDVDFKKHNSRNGNISTYLLARDIYTLTQRARKGTVLNTSGIESEFVFESDSSKAQKVAVTKDQIKDFTEWRMQSLDNVKSDPNALSSAITESGLFRATPEPIVTPEPIPEPPKSTPTEPETPLPTNMTQKISETKSSEVDTAKEESSSEETPMPIIDEYSSSETAYEESKPVEFENKPTEVSRTNIFDKYTSDNLETSRELLDLLSKIFPNINSSILSLNGTISSAKEFIANKSNRDLLTKLVVNKYGKSGEDLLNAVFNSFDSDINRANLINSINSLKPIVVTMQDHGKLRNGRKFSGDHIAHNNTWFDEFENDEFDKFARSNPTHNDIRTVIPNLGDQYKSVVNFIASSVRTGYFDSNKTFNDITSSPLIRRAISKFVGGNTSLWVIPYKNNQALLISRHQSKSDNLVFDIPILVLDGVTTYGKYNGTIDIAQGFRLAKNKNETHISLNELAQNSRLHISNNAGIIWVSGNPKSLSDLNENAEKSILNNNGHTYAVTTDEIALNRYLFNRDQQGVFRTDPSTGNALLDYGKYDYMGIQCLVDIHTFNKLLEKYRNEAELNTLNAESPKLFGGNNNESTEIAKTEILDNIKLIRSNGKIKQILPRDRAGKMLTWACSYIDRANFHLKGILNGNYRNGDYRKMYTLSCDGKEFAFIGDTIKQGFYNRDTGNFDVEFDTGVSVNSNNVIDDLNNVLELNYEPIHLIYHNYNTKTNKDFTSDVSTNWELAVILDGFTEENLNNLIDYLDREEGWSHGIYLDDAIRKDSKPVGSHYGILERGDRNYYTDRTEVRNYTEYVINLNDVDSTVISEETPKKSLNQFLAEQNLGFTANSIEEANNILRDKDYWWNNRFIEDITGDFVIRRNDASNINNWLKYRHGITTSLDNSNIDFLIKDLSTLGTNTLHTIGDLIYYKYNNGNVVFAHISNNNLAEDWNKSLDDLEEILDITTDISDYIASKYFDNVEYDQIKLLNLMKNNLELAEKIAIFEGDFKC